MQSKILLNADGSLPSGVTEADIKRLESLGYEILLVWPTEQPETKPGYMAVEGEPREEAGKYIQVWDIVEIPLGPPPTPEDVNAERDRRLRGSLNFDGDTFDCDSASLQRITGAATLAGFAIGRGAEPGDLLWHGDKIPFTWISNENRAVAMDAFKVFNFGQRAAKHETAHIIAARQLKDMPEIPRDYQDDKWWP